MHYFIDVKYGISIFLPPIGKQIYSELSLHLSIILHSIRVQEQVYSTAVPKEDRYEEIGVKLFVNGGN
jgi:hypothetical protein